MNKSPPKSTESIPFSSNSPSTSKTLINSDKDIQYNIVEDMKKVKNNISMHELSKLKQQQKFLLKELNVVLTSPLPIAKPSLGKAKPPDDSPNKIDALNVVLIVD